MFITIGNTRILIDPSTVKYEPAFLNEWKTATAILITHRHPDHINPDAVREINAPIYSTREVANAFPNLQIKTVRPKDMFHLGNDDAEITVMHAVHGYFPKMQTEIMENIGFTIDDGRTRAYYTGDTICFPNDYIADYVIAPTSGNCVTMDAVGAAAFTKSVGAKKLYVVHYDTFPLGDTERVLIEKECPYEIMENGKEYKLRSEAEQETPHEERRFL